MNIKENEQNLSIDKKIIYFFKKPGIVFSEFIEKPKYLWTMLLIILINIIYGIMQTTTSMDILKKSITDKFKDTPDISQALIGKAASIPIQVVTIIVTTIIGIYLASLVYMGLARIFGSKIKYKQIVSVYCLSMLSITIGKIVKWLYMAITNNPVGVKALAKPTLLNGFLDSFDIFNIWQIVLLTIGISVVGKISKKKSFAIVAICCIFVMIISLRSYLKL
ncbi:Yip1 family protein [Clostridium sp.]|uniref:Yip1 family protein n=1 Tax=Clostridium sp. TaxID=1506 RepID=UPI002FDCB6C3